MYFSIATTTRIIPSSASGFSVFLVPCIIHAGNFLCFLTLQIVRYFSFPKYCHESSGLYLPDPTNIQGTSDVVAYRYFSCHQVLPGELWFASA